MHARASNTHTRIHRLAYASTHEIPRNPFNSSNAVRSDFSCFSGYSTKPEEIRRVISPFIEKNFAATNFSLTGCCGMSARTRAYPLGKRRSDAGSSIRWIAKITEDRFIAHSHPRARSIYSLASTLRITHGHRSRNCNTSDLIHADW